MSPMKLMLSYKLGVYVNISFLLFGRKGEALKLVFRF